MTDNATTVKTVTKTLSVNWVPFENAFIRNGLNLFVGRMLVGVIREEQSRVNDKTYYKPHMLFDIPSLQTSTRLKRRETMEEAKQALELVAYDWIDLLE